MSQKPNLDPGSTQVDLSGIQEGTHPLVLEGGRASLTIDPATGRQFRGFRFEGSLERFDEDFRVRGSLTGTLESVCDRCLSGFDREIVADTVVLAAKSAREGESAPEGFVVLTPSSTVLDLSDAFREAALLAVPMKNVCRDGCLGICPTCGTNRNEEPCTCATSASDPRWDTLRGISFPSDPKE